MGGSGDDLKDESRKIETGGGDYIEGVPDPGSSKGSRTIIDALILLSQRGKLDAEAITELQRQYSEDEDAINSAVRIMTVEKLNRVQDRVDDVYTLVEEDVIKRMSTLEQRVESLERADERLERTDRRQDNKLWALILFSAALAITMLIVVIALASNGGLM